MTSERRMRCCLLAIGDEIVTGTTVDTNSAYLAELVRAAGFEPAGVIAVPDDETSILRALDRALEDAEIAISTGGLGPTADDLTTECVARLAGTELRLDTGSMSRIEDIFRARGREMPPNNRKQAMRPAGSELIPNPVGTAPGFICPVTRGGETRYVVCLPGVPREMRRMSEETLLPWLRSRQPGVRFLSRVFSTVGLTESRLDQLLAGVLQDGEGRLSFRAAFPRLQTRVTITGAAEDDLEGRLAAIEERVRARLGNHVYAVGDEGMEETVGRLLRNSGRTLAIAESCTGGLVGHRITDVPGSSAYFLLGLITYSNEAKQRLLGVGSETLERYGAVSPETAEEMAIGVRRAAGADIGLATTGIAGPDGGSPEKPVGTVCVAIASEEGVWSRRVDLGTQERGWIKASTAQLALDRLRRYLLGDPED
jgi:nicotinamide-nucleotide amidase